MKTNKFVSSLALSALVLGSGSSFVPGVAWAQTPGQQAVKPDEKTFSQQDLDQLLAPIALYPDALLAQILMASTYPLEIVQAARWSKSNPKVTGKSLETAMTKQSWDPSVKAMTAVPQVLQQMSEKIDWTQKLGDAFLSQKQDVMNTVQVLRAKAYAAGNLKTTEQQLVSTSTQGNQVIYVVQPVKTEVVHVPVYNPATVYGTWWYTYPPYYIYPPTYVYAPGIAFATGVVVGAAIWGHCHWGHGHSDININIAHYNSFNRTTIKSNTWNHNVSHRKGVAYADHRLNEQYKRNLAHKSGPQKGKDTHPRPSTKAANEKPFVEPRNPGFDTGDFRRDNNNADFHQGNQRDFVRRNDVSKDNIPDLNAPASNRDLNSRNLPSRQDMHDFPGAGRASPMRRNGPGNN